VDITGDASGGLDITVQSSARNAVDVRISISDPSGVEIYNGKAKSDTLVHLSIPDPQLWSPDSPSLYNVTVTLGDDKVVTHTAFRTINRSKVNGVVRPVLNGEAIFLFGTLE
jgi:beta-galactosidase/beta-glucuronidase